jgi:hypothetical protein
VKNRARASQGLLYLFAHKTTAAIPVLNKRACQIPMCIAAGRQRFANTGSAITKPDIAVLPHRLGKLDKPAMLFGGDECSGSWAAHLSSS